MTCRHVAETIAAHAGVPCIAGKARESKRSTSVVLQGQDARGPVRRTPIHNSSTIVAAKRWLSVEKRFQLQVRRYVFSIATRYRSHLPEPVVLWTQKLSALPNNRHLDTAILSADRRHCFDVLIAHFVALAQYRVNFKYRSRLSFVIRCPNLSASPMIADHSASR